MAPFIFVGPIIHSKSLQNLEIINKGIIVIVENKISYIQSSTDGLEQIQTKYEVADADVYRLVKGQILIPGLIDTHIHAPQYPNVGLGYDVPLLEWLQKYTFPLETKFKDEDFAQKVYEAIVKKTLSHGTTTCCYFATVHSNSSLILAKKAQSAGQRAFIGKVNMNKNTPPEYGETYEEALVNTRSFIDSILALNDPLIKPIITPRFALSCDMQMLKKLAEFASEYDISIQTHVSENTSEVEAVAAEFLNCANYVDVYRTAGLITNKTILAHGVHLKPEELSILKAHGTTISHCPSSNTMLQSGVCPVRQFLDMGLKVSLGTDCAGGYGVSMLESIRQALQVSIHASFSGLGEKLSIAELFYMATLGGAEALSLTNTTGNFEAGKDFDALLINLQPALDLLEDYTAQQLFQKLVYLGDDRVVEKVYVAGRLVKDVNVVTHLI